MAKKYRWVLILLLVTVCGCSTVAVQQAQLYNLSNNQHLHKLAAWSFQGRVAVSNKSDSWSAALVWTHQPDQDSLKISGYLGQGTVLIKWTAEQIEIDQGNGRVDYAADADQLIADKLGVHVPLSALKYWVLGLVQPGVDFIASDEGFQQSAWTVNYPLYRAVKGQLMPYKMKATRDLLTLTLVFDQWQL